MKVLLIQPPFSILKAETKKCHPPLGLAYLAAALREEHEVGVLDCLAEGFDNEAHFAGQLRYGLGFPEIRKRIKDFSPDAVGISACFSAQMENVFKVCGLVKEINPKVITILGGAHASTLPEELLKEKFVDFVVIGEGEEVLKRLLGRIEAKKDFSDLEGIGFRNNNYIRLNHKNTFEEVLDKLAFPYWEIFPLEKYFRINSPHGSPARKVPFLPMITSRGCPFDCVFCSVHNLWGKAYRKRSPENVLSEIRHLVKIFGVKEIMFEDDNLTLERERANQIFGMIIKEGFRIAWSVPNGVAVQTLDREMLELMKASGCYRISIGVESGDEYILKDIIKKPITLSRIKPIIESAKQLGMESVAFFVVGFPQETRARLKATLRFAEYLLADNTNFFFATPLPGTRLLALCHEEGLITSDFDYASLKSELPSFSTRYFSKKQLYSIIMRQRLKMQLLYLLKNPRRGLYKISLKLWRSPRDFIRHILNNIKGMRLASR